MDKFKYISGIVNENAFRLYVLKNYNNLLNWIADYNKFKPEIADYIESIRLPLEMSNNYYKLNYLKEPIKDRKYYPSKLKIDYSYSLECAKNNAETIYNLLLKIDFNEYELLFLTIDFAHLLDYTLFMDRLNSYRKMFLYLTQNLIPNLMTGLILKYELAYSLNNDLLYLNPHCHCIIKVPKTKEQELKQTLYNYFCKSLDKPEIDFHITNISKDKESLIKISKYICKDVYKYIFHYIDRKKGYTSFKIPFAHIAFIISQLKNYHFIHSYGDLKFKLYYRKGRFFKYDNDTKQTQQSRELFSHEDI